MANNYPTSLNNYTGSETLANAGHSSAHNALEAKVGITSSAVTTSHEYKIARLTDDMFNVKAYGAVGDNSTDDTTAIQNALTAANSAGGGVVYFPKATYKITTALTLYSSVTLQGAGMEVSVIHQVTGSSTNGLVGDGLSSVCIYDLTIQGNGTGSTPGSSGIGISLTYGGNGNNPYHNFRNVHVTNWGSDGVRIQTPIVCTMQKVYSSYNGAHGFNWYEGGTSVNFQNCWARQNTQAGYRFNTSVYQSLTGCAADNNGINYLVQGAQSIGFFSCGSEGALVNTTPYLGYGWQIDNSSVITLDACWVTDNRNLGVWVTNGANGVSLNIADNTPNVTAVNFIKVDSGCNVTINNLHNTTANSLAAGTTLIVNDGTGAVTSPDHLILKAGTNSLVKSTVLRQDDTTNTYKAGNAVTLTGWGVMTIGAAANASETVTFGITFAQRPIVVLSFGGDAASATTYGSGGNTVKGPVASKAHTITTTNFVAQIHSSDGTSWSAGNTVFYQWIAIGEL